MIHNYALVESTSSQSSPESVLLPDVCAENPTIPIPIPRQHRKPIKNCPSLCQICRHPATGYHYDVPSCNGCKTFFRRSILDGRKYSCAKMKKCMSGTEPIDLTRRMCRSCRFEKCVECGMNPSAILADAKSSDGEELRQEIMIKQQTVRLNSPPVILSFEEQINQVIDQLTVFELKVEPLYTRGFPPGFKDTRKLEDVLKSPIIFNFSDIPNPSFSAPPIDEITGRPKPAAGCYLHTCLLANLEYSKMFEFSEKLDFDSQLLLLKHAATMCSDMMMAFYSFDRMKSDKLLHPNGLVSGPPVERYGLLGDKQRNVMQKTLISILRNQVNRVEYLFLKAIVLCNPAVSGLPTSAQQIIGSEREKYVKCLLTYCLINHGSLNGPSRFSSLISIITVLENQQKNSKDFHQLAKAILMQSSPDLQRISALFEQIMDS